MATDQITANIVVWAFSFGFGSIFSWLVWLTIRHFNYGKPAYEELAGDDLDDGHLEATDDRFKRIERTHTELASRVDDVEQKVDKVNTKSDRNYRLLEKIAEKANVNGIFFRSGSSSGAPPSDDD